MLDGMEGGSIRLPKGGKEQIGSIQLSVFFLFFLPAVWRFCLVSLLKPSDPIVLAAQPAAWKDENWFVRIHRRQLIVELGGRINILFVSLSPSLSLILAGERVKFINCEQFSDLVERRP